MYWEIGGGGGRDIVEGLFNTKEVVALFSYLEKEQKEARSLCNHHPPLRLVETIVIPTVGPLGGI